MKRKADDILEVFGVAYLHHHKHGEDFGYKDQAQKALMNDLLAMLPVRIDIEAQPHPSDEELIAWRARNVTIGLMEQSIRSYFGEKS